MHPPTSAAHKKAHFPPQHIYITIWSHVLNPGPVVPWEGATGQIRYLVCGDLKDLDCGGQGWKPSKDKPPVLVTGRSWWLLGVFSFKWAFVEAWRFFLLFFWGCCLVYLRRVEAKASQSSLVKVEKERASRDLEEMVVGWRGYWTRVSFLGSQCFLGDFLFIDLLGLAKVAHGLMGHRYLTGHYTNIKNSGWIRFVAWPVRSRPVVRPCTT